MTVLVRSQTQQQPPADLKTSSSTIGSKTEGNSVAGRVRFDPVAKIRSIPAIIERENIWWQREDLSKEKLELHAMIENYQRQLDGRPRWLLNRQQRQTCESLQDVVRVTKRLLASSKGKKDSQALASQLEGSLDRSELQMRGIEYGLIPKRKVLERQHVKKICKAQKRENPMKLADKAAASSQRCVLLAQIVARHDATQARICWDEESEALLQ